MNVQITHVIVHTDEQAQEIIDKAVSIADRADRDSDAWAPIFREACRLLGQRYTFVAAPQTVDLGQLAKTPMAIPRGNRH